MEDEKLNAIEASLLVVIVIISHIILDFPNIIIKSTYSAAMLNVIFVSILAILFFLIVNKLFKPFEGQNILSVAEFVGGKKLKIVLSIIFSIYLSGAASVVIRSFSETLKVVYFPNAALWTILAIFLIIAVFANKCGARNVIKVNTLLTPYVLITMIIIFAFSFKYFDINRIFPILGNGFNETFIKRKSKHILICRSNIFVFYKAKFKKHKRL